MLKRQYWFPQNAEMGKGTGRRLYPTWLNMIDKMPNYESQRHT